MGDGTQGILTIKITEVVITMVTKRSCIPIARINDFSGVTYIQIDIHMHILIGYSLW